MIENLPVTLCFAAAAAQMNIWHTHRTAKVRHDAKVSVGDGGNDLLLRRMRAHGNFIEQVPITLALIFLIELIGKGGKWLALVAILYIALRIVHAIAMDGKLKYGREISMTPTLILQGALASIAFLAAVGLF